MLFLLLQLPTENHQETGTAAPSSSRAAESADEGNHTLTAGPSQPVEQPVTGQHNKYTWIVILVTK